MPKKNKIEIKETTDNPAINLALDTIKINKQALIFVNSKKSAEKTAEDIAGKLEIEKNMVKFSDDVLNILATPTKQCERLAYCLRKGIAFHHAGLNHKQKEMIEDAFREKKIKIIACTPTLAYGLDLPAFRAIIKNLTRFGALGMSYIPVLEFHQMAGRAGRPRYDKEGQAICIAQSESQKDEITERFIKGEPEEIYSKLAVEPVLRTYLLSLIAAKFVNNKKEILDFFEKTFWAHQFKDMRKLDKIITRMLRLLEEFEFIRISSSKEEFVSADEIADEKIKATLLGERVAELYIDPLTAHEMITGLKRADSVMLKPFSFVHLVSSTLEMRPLLRVKTREFDKVQEKFTEYERHLLKKEPSIYDPEYNEFLNSIKTALFLQGWMDEIHEDELLKAYDIRPGEIRVKLDIADWLLYACEEFAKLLHFQKLLKEISKVRFRVKYGVKEELFPLLKLKNIGRIRARKLFRNNIKDLKDVKKANIITLVQIIGKGIAIDIKKQVGQNVEKLKIPERKRKGQISLKDYNTK